MKIKKVKPKGKNETAILREIMDYLAEKQVFFWRQNTLGRFDYRRGVILKRGRFEITGISDILGVYEGRFLAIEVKVPGNKPTENQKIFLQRIADEGGIAVVATSVEDVKKMFKLL